MSGNRKPARPQPLPVEYQLVSGAKERVSGFLTEMTLASALLEPASGPALEVGTRLRLYVRLLGFDEEILVRSVVRWDRRGVAGLQFFKLGERDVQLLMELIAAAESSARSAGPTRRT